MFTLTEEQNKKVADWNATLEDIYTGAIGGRLTYSFTPTSLGTVIVVSDSVTETEINVTDYESW